MEQEGQRLKMVRQGDVTLVELMEKKILDEAMIAEIGEQLFALAAESPLPRIVLDFGNVAHMSSSALGTLITLHKRVSEKGGHLRLCNIRPSIYDVFVITRLNEVFKICADRAEAVSQAGSS